MQGGNNDYETLEPHTYIYDYRQNESSYQTGSDFLNPENLR